MLRITIVSYSILLRTTPLTATIRTTGLAVDDSRCCWMRGSRPLTGVGDGRDGTQKSASRVCGQQQNTRPLLLWLRGHLCRRREENDRRRRGGRVGGSRRNGKRVGCFVRRPVLRRDQNENIIIIELFV